jgi:hypothetical protein
VLALAMRLPLCVCVSVEPVWRPPQNYSEPTTDPFSFSGFHGCAAPATLPLSSHLRITISKACSNACGKTEATTPPAGGRQGGLGGLGFGEGSEGGCCQVEEVDLKGNGLGCASVVVLHALLFKWRQVHTRTLPL